MSKYNNNLYFIPGIFHSLWLSFYYWQYKVLFISLHQIYQRVLSTSIHNIYSIYHNSLYSWLKFGLCSCFLDLEQKCLLWRCSYLKLLTSPNTKACLQTLASTRLPTSRGTHLISSVLPKHKETARLASFIHRAVLFRREPLPWNRVIHHHQTHFRPDGCPAACSYCYVHVVHLRLNDWWVTRQRLTALLIAPISHVPASGALNVTSLFKEPHQQTPASHK